MKSVGEVLALGRTFGRGLRQGHGRARARRGRRRAAGRPREAASSGCARRRWDRYDLIAPGAAAGRRRRATAARRPASTPGSCAELERLAARPRGSSAGRWTGLDGDRPCAARAERAWPTATSPPPSARTSWRWAGAGGRWACVPTYHAVDTCAAEFAAADALLLLGLRDRERAARGRPAGHRRARLGAEPHRPGDRVRLLLRARRRDRPRARLRRGDGQLQPGDGLHRPRRQRPPLPGAGDHRRRARHLRAPSARSA